MNAADQAKQLALVTDFQEGQRVTWRMQTRGDTPAASANAVVRKLGDARVQIEVAESVRGELIRSILWVPPHTLCPRERANAQPGSISTSARRTVMASVNKVILIGNLGRDSEVRYGSDGGAFCKISVATTSQWTDKETGEVREETEWHRVVLFNRLAEIAGQYLKKGQSVYIEGRLKTSKWQDKDTGQDRYATEVVADQMQMLGGARQGRAGAGTDSHSDTSPAQDDDLPF